MLKVGSDFSGVGAFDQTLIRLRIDYTTVFACDMDKYSRKTYIANYGEPAYFPENVYDREIPSESLDIYMTSPPCQAFSLAGKRLGKEDERGILFFNSHEFIIKNKPRFFIFENVKGLLSDDGGKTFQEWVNYLGGKSVNGVHTLFPTDEAAPYHIYYRILNAKKHGIPQNRERIFIVGIRDDEDNVFDWPREVPLTKKLADVLEDEVDEKYFLSNVAVERIMRTNYSKPKIDPDITGTINTTNNSARLGIDSGTTLISNSGLSRKLKIEEIPPPLRSHDGCGHDNIIVVGNVNPSGNGMNGNVFDSNGISPTLSTNKGEGIKIMQLNDPVHSNDRVYDVDGIAPTLNTMQGGLRQPFIAQRGHGFVKDSEHEISPTITGEKWKDNNHVVYGLYSGVSEDFQRPPLENLSRTIKANKNDSCVSDGYSIRRLTPTECFRLMDFPDSLVENAREVGMSDSQLYKQSGNSIVVACLVGIINGMRKLVK